MTKILAESLPDFREVNKPVKKLNEGAKQLLSKFINAPEDPKAKARFKKAFAVQTKKLAKLGLDVGALIDTFELNQMKELATEALEKIKANPGQDRPQLPVVKTKKGILALKTGEGISGSGLSGRGGIHGGTKK